MECLNIHAVEDFVSRDAIRIQDSLNKPTPVKLGHTFTLKSQKISIHVTKDEFAKQYRQACRELTMSADIFRAATDVFAPQMEVKCVKAEAHIQRADMESIGGEYVTLTAEFQAFLKTPEKPTP